MVNVALIGGSGIYLPDMLEDVVEDTVETPYGKVTYSCGQINDKKIVFIPRHGKGHSVPPHKINYHANIWGLKKLGVKYIVASTAVGSLNPAMKVGEFVVPDQLLDFTKGRSTTFFDGKDNKVVHVDLTEPYCPAVSSIIADTAADTDITVHKGGTYVCAEGPRFETAAEIKMYRILGGDIVGMTAVPELVLAREAEMCYSTFSLVTNMAAGLSEHPLSHQEVYDCVAKTNDKIMAFLKKALAALSEKDFDCACLHAIKDFGGFKV